MACGRQRRYALFCLPFTTTRCVDNEGSSQFQQRKQQIRGGGTGERAGSLSLSGGMRSLERGTQWREHSFR